MPWKEPRFLVFEPTVRASYIKNGLAFDGSNYFALASGPNVHCVRSSIGVLTSPDFKLEREDDRTITSLLFWPAARPSNPPLVLAVAQSSKLPAALEFHDASLGSRSFTLAFEDAADNIAFLTGLSTLSCDDLGEFVLAGASNGTVLAVAKAEKDRYRVAFTLRGLAAPVTDTAADINRRNFIAATDEAGNLIVWKVDKKSDGLFHQRIAYKYCDKEDFIEVVEFRKAVVICGHNSGKVSFHHVGHAFPYAEFYTNARRITSIDVFDAYNWVLIGGEDCRITMMQIPVVDNESHSKILFSLCLNAAVLGSVFTNRAEKVPDFALLPWDMPYLIEYRYDKSVDPPATPMTGSDVSRISFAESRGTSEYGARGRPSVDPPSRNMSASRI